MKLGVFVLPGWEKHFIGGYKTAMKNFLRMFGELGIEVTVNPLNFDADIYYFYAALPIYLPLAKLLKARGKKIILHVHTLREDILGTFTAESITAPLYLKIASKMASLADLILTPTEYARQRVIEELGADGNKVFAISNGIDIERFERISKPVKSLKVFGNVSAVLYRKGVLDFVRIGKGLQEKMFIWYGKILPFGILSRGKEIKEAITTSPENVVFYGYAKDILAAYKVMDSFISTSLAELEGIPIIEAAAAGLPLFLRDIPPYREKFTDSEAFFWKTPEEAIELIRSTSVDEARKKARLARKKVRKYSLEAVKKRLKKILKKLE